MDRTIKWSLARALSTRGNAQKFMRCEDLVSPPQNEHGSPLSRYIAFVDLGRCFHTENATVTRMRRTLAGGDNVGLTACEGLHLIGQHKEFVSYSVVNLVGSRADASSSPAVGWKKGLGIQFWIEPDNTRNQFAGAGTRSQMIIPVTAQ